MSRTLTSAVSTAVAATGTRPRYLVELGFNTTLRLCTGETLTWDSATWTASDLQVGAINVGQGGAMTAQLTFQNQNNTYASLVLNEGARGKTARIWKLYGDGPTFALDDAEPIFDGYMDAVPRIEDTLVITLRSQGAGAVRTPRNSLALWVGEDMVAPGTKLLWGGTVYTLEAQD